MKNTFDRIQIVLVIVFFLDCLLLIAFFAVSRSLYMTNIFGYIGMFILGSLFFYTGTKQLSQSRKNGVALVWYKQPWLLIGSIVCILAIAFLLTKSF